jgi:hypothetical protein
LRSVGQFLTQTFMKYSLRTLTIVVGFICLILAAWVWRVDYLRRMADFHDKESERYASRLQRFILKPAGAEFDTCVRKMNFHEEYAKSFRDASKHPWRLVHEPQRELGRESARRPRIRNRIKLEIHRPDSSAPAPDSPKP